MDARDDLGYTPLFETVFDNGTMAIDNIDIIRELAQRGANVNPRDTMGETPLIWAAEFGSDDLVRALIDLGANLEAEDKLRSDR